MKVDRSPPETEKVETKINSACSCGQHHSPKELTAVYLTAAGDLKDTQSLVGYEGTSNPTIPSPSPGSPCKKVLATASGMLN